MEGTDFELWEENRMELGALRLIAASLLHHSSTPITTLIKLTLISRYVTTEVIWEPPVIRIYFYLFICVTLSLFNPLY
jgi:hypothetical protein